MNALTNAILSYLHGHPLVGVSALSITMKPRLAR